VILDFLTDEGMRYFAELPLQNLRLVECRQISNIGLAYLQSATTLQHLDVTACPITQEALCFLPKTLISLALDYSCRGEWIKNLKGQPLEELTVGALTDEDMETLLEINLPLKTLWIDGLFLGSIGAKCLPQLGLQLLQISDPDLEVIDLSKLGCKIELRLSRRGGEPYYKELVKQQAPLSSLMTYNETDGVILQIAKITSLQKLNLWNYPLTDTSLELLSCLSLTDLALQKCTEITEKGLNQLVGLPLEILYLYDLSIGPEICQSLFESSRTLLSIDWVNTVGEDGPRCSFLRRTRSTLKFALR